MAAIAGIAIAAKVMATNATADIDNIFFLNFSPLKLIVNLES